MTCTPILLLAPNEIAKAESTHDTRSIHVSCTLLASSGCHSRLCTCMHPMKNILRSVTESVPPVRKAYMFMRACRVPCGSQVASPPNELRHRLSQQRETLMSAIEFGHEARCGIEKYGVKACTPRCSSLQLHAVLVFEYSIPWKEPWAGQCCIQTSRL